MNFAENTMLKNIQEEAVYFRKLLENKEEITNKFIPLFKDHDIRRIYILGHGSTNYATVAIKYLFVKFLGIDASHDVATIFNNYEGFNEKYDPKQMLLICPAATGRTKGPVLAAREARKKGILVLGSGEYDNNVLARECDVFINKMTGDENAYVDTKGHSATLFLYAMCIIETAYALNRLSKKEYEEYMQALKEIIDNHERLFTTCMQWYDAHSETMLKAKLIRIVSYGINYATSLEAGLKLSESTLQDAIGYDLEQFLHGPNMPSHTDDVFFFVNPKNGIEYDRENLTYELMKKEGFVKSYLVTDRDNPSLQKDDGALTFDFVEKEFLSYIQYVVFFQVLAARKAMDLHIDTRTQPEAFVHVTSVLETSFKEN